MYLGGRWDDFLVVQAIKVFTYMVAIRIFLPVPIHPLVSQRYMCMCTK